MIDRLRSLHRDEDGFSLIELLSALAIGGIVLTALMGIFVGGVRGTTGIQNRLDNTERARYTLDRVVRLLDSQVCAQLTSTSDVGTPPVFSGSDSNTATFFADLAGATGTPNKYVIAYTPKSGTTGGTLSVATYAYNAGAWTTKVGPTNVVASDIVPVKNAAGVDQPIFSYYPFITSSAVASDVGNVSTTPAATPLSAGAALTIVKVGVQFAAISSTSHLDNAQHAYVSGSGTLATFDADPTNPTACP
jgi:prepilin-type N-terminal cleavage/methylation domain-containing protein